MYETTFPAMDGNSGSQGGWKGNQNNSGGSGGWKGNQGGGNSGGWKGGGDRKFQPKPEEIDPTLYLSVAFTGDKDTPPDVLNKVKELARWLESQGFTIRVGGDGPFEEAAEMAVNKKELLLPWKDFNNKTSNTTFSIERAHHIAKLFHSAYENMKKGIQGILAKNARLLMGQKMMSPATLLVTWTPDGVEDGRNVTVQSGFSGHSVKIASAARVPVFNLAKPDAESRIRNFVSGAA